MRRALVASVAVLLASLVGCSSPQGLEVAAEFERAVGLYPGSPVRLQGIDVGEVTEIVNERGLVRVDMRLDDDARVPADARAVIVPLSLLGERYVQLGPVHDGGPELESGDVIPVSRTAVPAEIDELLEGFEKFLGHLDERTVAGLVSNLAHVLEGQGEAINELIGNGAATVELLADESDELSGITRSLAQLTEALQSRTQAITSLIRNYDVVAGAVASERDDLEGAIVELNRASSELADLLLAHRNPLERDVETLTTVGRTLQRNIDRFDVVLENTVRLFSAAGRAYDPERNWLPLNNQAPPRQSSDAVTSAVRDRLAGVCRRLAARLGDTAPPDLYRCGDPDSGYFDPILGAVPGVLEGGDPRSAAAGQFARGLEVIPGLTAEQKRAVATTPSSTTTSSSVPLPGVSVPGVSSSTSLTLPPKLLPDPPEREHADDGGLLDRLLGWFGW